MNIKSVLSVVLLLSIFSPPSFATSDALGADGRAIMRTAGGEIYSTVIRDSQLAFLKKGKNSEKWETILLTFGDGMPVKNVKDASIDSGMINGAYIAFSVEFENQKRPYLAEILDPINNPGSYKIYGPLLDENVESSFVAVTKGVKEGMAAAWQTSKGDIFVASKTAKSPVSFKKVVSDKDMLTGLAISTAGRNTMVNYLTKNEKFCNRDCDTSSSVFIESKDFGKTWSKPDSLYKSDSELPSLAEFISSEKGFSKQDAKLSRFSASSTQFVSLSWQNVLSRTGKGGKGKKGKSKAIEDLPNQEIYFITNTLTVHGSNDLDNGVGVVSFREVAGGDWTHVIANDDIIVSNSDGKMKLGSAHQYSALPGTPVRGVMYTESSDEDAYILSLSIDTGKTFDHFLRLSARDLGVNGDLTDYKISACLFKGENGEVYQDVAMISDGKYFHKKIPTGIKVDNKEAVIW